MVWKERDFAKYKTEIQNNLNSLRQKDEELLHLIGSTKLRIETSIASVESAAKQNATNIQSLITSATEDRELLKSVNNMTLE